MRAALSAYFQRRDRTNNIGNLHEILGLSALAGWLSPLFQPGVLIWTELARPVGADF
jgi:hypothetical protein